MKSSRRGFFATLAALPAVVMGRKAVAAPPDWWPMGTTGRTPIWGAVYTTDAATGRRVVHRFEDGRPVEAYSEEVTGRRLWS